MGWGGGWVAKHTHTHSQMKFVRFCMTIIEPVQKLSRSNDVSNIVQSTKSNITK